MQQNLLTHRAIRRKSALLLFPDASDRETLELALSVRGHSVVACTDADYAIEVLRHDHSYAYVLVRWDTPDRMAEVFLSSISSLPAEAAPTVVAIGADAAELAEGSALAAGADGYIQWPVEFDALYSCLDSIGTRSRDGGTQTHTTQDQSAELFVINEHGVITHSGPVVESLLGYPADTLTGINVFTLFDHGDLPSLLAALTQALARGGESRRVTLHVRNASDAPSTLALSTVNQLNDPQVAGIRIMVHGRDARVQSDPATRAVMHDPVTELPNRSLFIDRVDHAVARANRHQQSVVVMTVDFNGYTPVGHDHPRNVSDRLIGDIARRLGGCLRLSDTAARLGHDEFGLLLEEIVDPENVQLVADRIVETMSAAFRDGDATVEFAPNIGIVVSTFDRNRAVDLLHDANVARAWARVQGSGCNVMFDPSMGAPGSDVDAPAGEHVAAAPSTSTNTTAIHPSVEARLSDMNARLAGIESMLEHLTRLASVDTR